MIPETTTRPVEPRDLPAIDSLQDRAFGPGRFVRTAYRIREGMPLISRACLVAFRQGRLAAALRMSPIEIGGRSGALLLGPLAVEPELAGQGIGRRLIAESLERARRLGYRLVLLVGDQPYYGRFGFAVVPRGRIELPGPVDYGRLLAAELVPGALADYAGPVQAGRELGACEAASAVPAKPDTRAAG